MDVSQFSAISGIQSGSHRPSDSDARTPVTCLNGSTFLEAVLVRPFELQWSNGISTSPAASVGRFEESFGGALIGVSAPTSTEPSVPKPPLPVDRCPRPSPGATMRTESSRPHGNSPSNSKPGASLETSRCGPSNESPITDGRL